MRIFMYADNTHVKIIRNSHLGRKYPNRTQYTVAFAIVSAGKWDGTEAVEGQLICLLVSYYN